MGPGQSTIGATTGKPPSVKEVPEVCEMLAGELDGLHEALDQLEGACLGISRPLGPETTNTLPTDPRYSTIGARLQASLDQVRRATLRVADLSDRLEV